MSDEVARLRAENASLKRQLSQHECLRYGRQMIVPEFGSLAGQHRLGAARVLVVGAGGLGCPVLMYLCGAGVGTIGVLDHDTVDVSNLHRQVLHTSVNVLKCESAKLFLNQLNPNVAVVTHPHRLASDNAFDVVEPYSVVVDCTDNPATRYLLNDVCVLLGKPLVSGSGVRAEGQFTVLNLQGGPCYRCFHPTPPETVSTCSDAGVVGPAIGLTGTALAMETIKVVTGFYTESFQPFLASYSAYPHQSIRTFKMRGRVPTCAVCGDRPLVSRERIVSGAIDYADFCRQPVYPDPGASVSVHNVPKDATIIDVRPKEQFQISHIPNSINIEWELLSRTTPALPKDLYVICRHGNDSRLATQRLRALGYDAKNIIGGIAKWSEKDPSVYRY